MRIARPLTYALHGLHVAPWLPSGHMHARVPPRSEVAALTRRAHPLKTPGVMPGQSLEARTAAISQGLCRCV